LFQEIVDFNPVAAPPHASERRLSACTCDRFFRGSSRRNAGEYQSDRIRPAANAAPL
jgi:hypothetical protein